MHLELELELTKPRYVGREMAAPAVAKENKEC